MDASLDAAARARRAERAVEGGVVYVPQALHVSPSVPPINVQRVEREINMAASQQHMHAGTPMGAQLVDGGATFRTWAPAAKEVYLVL